MKCELVRVRTDDNVHLHGLIYPPIGKPDIELDAAICIHGLGGNFYGSRLTHAIGQQLCKIGLSVAHINTRGHDDINQTARNGRNVNLGAAFEIVDECRFDIDGWIKFLLGQGMKRIALVGHSLGAIKSIYAQALQPHDAVQAIVAISASRLSFNRFLQLPTRDQFLAVYEKAKSLIEQGKPDELMRVDFPFPTYMIAGAYVDKYGPDDRYNWLNYANRIQVPCLLTFGEIELEEIPAFMGILDDIDQLELPQHQFDLATIDGANHFYAARQSELAATIANWLKDRFGN